MKRSPLQPIGEVLARAAPPMDQLVTKARHLVAINQTVIEHLDAPIHRHCRVANTSADTVVIEADSPAWSTKARFHAPEILAVLRERCGLATLRTARVRVAVPDTEPISPTKPAERRPSPASADIIRQTALAIEDPRLRHALLRLSRSTALASLD